MINNTIREQLISVCIENGLMIENDNINNDIDLKTLISDSLQYINIIIAIEEKFNVELPDDFLINDGYFSLNSLAIWLTDFMGS